LGKNVYVNRNFSKNDVQPRLENDKNANKNLHTAFYVNVM